MSADFVYSVRMRASTDGRHVSGAERLVEAGDVDAAVATLTARARNRAEEPDAVQVTVERVARSTVSTERVLRLIITPPSTAALAQVAGSIRLRDAGVSDAAIDAAFELLRNGIGTSIQGRRPPNPQSWGDRTDSSNSESPESRTPGRAARGAMLIDASTGENVTPDARRGVRASRFDYGPEAAAGIDQALTDAGLGHFRTREALALASKVIWSGVLAELCWSDDAEYVAGYVSTRDGYVRFADFKPEGAVGGRAFFVDTSAIRVETVVENLERRALWIEGPLEIVSVI